MAGLLRGMGVIAASGSAAVFGTVQQSQKARPCRCELTTLPATDLSANELDTGDILVFDRNCASFGPYGRLLCSFSKALPGEPWDHVALVVRVNDEPHVLEASFTGVKLRPFNERMNLSKSNRIMVRRLYADRDDAFRETTDNFVQEVVGKPYERNMLEMFRAAYVSPSEREHTVLMNELLYKKSELRTLELQAGSMSRSYSPDGASLPIEKLRKEIDSLEVKVHEAEKRAKKDILGTNKEEDLSSVFCSELVAAAYQRLGLLPHFPRSNEYLPTDFIDCMPLQHGARLSNELYQLK
eukprot:TRINITY_DN4057_c0_g1::TRINITY_DN4057_c0_g1_i1::g.11841::m.11841 TRINITY_DN4057_c0_g1::TRINITY_DN4057_c0_g1_i1::g.11841  ORF type:complete len:297 (+),score=28.08,DUF830/PF05708.7/1.3e-07,DUF830/PF05708.7/0.36,Ribosomal_L36e/PF01158.13/0.26,Ribosomal_L36e/PF01158.13/5.2e+03,TFIIE-A_C-term/PF11521.3/8.3e+03,TFIIE-A_C-term/PF11521.3/0.36 TRINITY_DN4057_c0_g1_i1:242-1132(+)